MTRSTLTTPRAALAIRRSDDLKVPIRLGEEVRAALDDGRPVVALETNVTANGLPAPRRVAAGLECERRVRASGAVPASLAVLDGTVVVGLVQHEHERLAEGARKIGSRELAATVASRGSGATTISAAMAVAELTGIDVVASAGLGGVHRDYGDTMDVSADLHQLARSRVVVVSAGVKSVLDIARTLEFLETRGVPVIGYRCDDFPAFLCRSSGLPNPQRIDDPQVLADAIRLHRTLPGTGSVLVTHPIAVDDALDEQEVGAAIERALVRAAAEGVRGAAVTNFLTREVAAATVGRSSVANEAVVLQVAAVGAEVAAALAVTPPRQAR
ncbi:pseudouridine-5'-phosphate glycosidase [Aeromicrobium sp. REDSEA-S38_B2]|jgi:pseudouridine-5'-phosphate glycosidase|uniref:pseudouridine-5'-phosphate glycosidase n=1 Tax=Aeromicrobium sp. REDSEA-S38_B2 TaxID=1811528 RepID=UPI000A73E1C9|nr:pseudouridine-5'-phosphate glycosidase [Aeromicrobium sp. REDSEA-S38_B2]